MENDEMVVSVVLTKDRSDGVKDLGLRHGIINNKGKTNGKLFIGRVHIDIVIKKFR
jgi:hypothetical protein